MVLSVVGLGGEGRKLAGILGGYLKGGETEECWYRFDTVPFAGRYILFFFYILSLYLVLVNVTQYRFI